MLSHRKRPFCESPHLGIHSDMMQARPLKHLLMHVLLGQVGPYAHSLKQLPEIFRGSRCATLK